MQITFFIIFCLDMFDLSLLAMVLTHFRVCVGIDSFQDLICLWLF